MDRACCRDPTPPPVTIAVVDIGTNTILLLIARVDSSGTLTPLRHEQRIPRLGEGVDRRRLLHPDAMERAIQVLQEYSGIIDAYAPDARVLCATSAVRDAANRAEFIGAVRAAMGFRIEVLSGSEEARWTYRGALSGIPDVARATVIDIGGGSTEITLGDQRAAGAKASLDVGSVRLTERFFRHDPPLPEEIEAARDAVTAAMAATGQFAFRGTTAVAVAGTATTLSLLAQGRKEYDLDAVSNSRLTSGSVEQLLRMLGAMPSARIRELSEVMEGRADIITAGALILHEVMTHAGFDEVIVSERGVRYGIALREWERHGPELA